MLYRKKLSELLGLARVCEHEMKKRDLKRSLFFSLFCDSQKAGNSLNVLPFHVFELLGFLAERFPLGKLAYRLLYRVVQDRFRHIVQINTGAGSQIF